MRGGLVRGQATRAAAPTPRGGSRESNLHRHGCRPAAPAAAQRSAAGRGGRRLEPGSTKPRPKARACRPGEQPGHFDRRRAALDRPASARRARLLASARALRRPAASVRHGSRRHCWRCCQRAGGCVRGVLPVAGAARRPAVAHAGQPLRAHQRAAHRRPDKAAHGRHHEPGALSHTPMPTVSYTVASACVWGGSCRAGKRAAGRRHSCQARRPGLRQAAGSAPCQGEEMEAPRLRCVCARCGVG